MLLVIIEEVSGVIIKSDLFFIASVNETKNPIGFKIYRLRNTENKDITVHEGKYGPYVKCGKIMASLIGEQTIDNINLELAIELISNRKTKIKKKKKK